MSHQRVVRKNGEIIELSGMSYRIERLEGMGGSSIVYQASYEDHLSSGERHEVYIKELFPYDPRGNIYRDEAGFVRCTPEGAARMEDCRVSFLRGNEANLKLLRSMPTQTSGNLDSCEAYGTYYSILTLHGGENLQSILDGSRPGWTLREAAVIVCRILQGLSCFHENGFLHLDISPDNILLLREQALLIDYNSVWSMDSREDEKLTFSEKKGYSAPEVRLKDIREIGPAADLYSVCAVFFRMLSGRTLTDEEILGKGLRKTLAAGFPILEGEPAPAACKTAQILSKGLHVLARKRYQSVEEMREELEELIDRIDRKGVSHASIWESSRAYFQSRRYGGRPVLSRQIYIEGKKEEAEGALWEVLSNGSCILLIGAGGMGKTVLLREIWRRSVSRYMAGQPTVVYISLKEYQEAEGTSEYIRHTLLRRLNYRKEQNTWQDAMHELECFLDGGETGRVNVILLLDGLNEAGTRRERLLGEIGQLGAKAGTAVLVTDRTDEVKRYALKAFQTAQILPLEESVVASELEIAGCSLPQDQGLLQLLVNPMMLALYQDVMKMRGADTGTEMIQSMDGLVRLYLDELCQRQMRIHSGDQAMQLCDQYILGHLLTAVAGRMTRKKRTLLTLDELLELASESYRHLQEKRFGKAFPEYLGKSRQMLSDICGEAEWFDFAVTEQLVANYGLLVKGENGDYGLIHDNFQSCLAETDRQNRKRYRARHISPQAAGTALAVVFLTGVVAFSGGRAQPEIQEEEAAPGASYTQEEQEAIDRALVCAQFSLGVLDAQLSAQDAVLKKAQESAVLEGDIQEIENFREYMQRNLKNVMMNTRVVVKPDEELIQELIAIENDFPIEELLSLCDRPDEILELMTEAFVSMEELFCGERGQYSTADERRKAAETYQAYLDAYRDCVFYEFDYITLRLSPERVVELLNESRYVSLMSDYYKEIDAVQQDQDQVKIRLATAEEQLKLARGRMIAAGLISGE